MGKSWTFGKDKNPTTWAETSAILKKSGPKKPGLSERIATLEALLKEKHGA